MTLPFSLPDWVPWWLPFAVLVPGLLYLLAFLLMPFSVFGVKGRLEGVEARLDEIQAEIRGLALRLPEPLADGGYGEDLHPIDSPAARPAQMHGRPPIPPAPPAPGMARDARAFAALDQKRGREQPAPSERTEPRLDWPG
jgi:hypothetical protein